ncbi:MAG: TIGR03086 family metal-binding protein [Ilumatobacteraceae bacterium]|nr:TIGR03086 family metal-binding protein [Ilumatobacteraceae bacterium]
MTPTEQLSQILPALNDTVGQIRADQLDNPTPCDEFTVHDILDHMMVLGATFTYQYHGETPPEITPPPVYGRVPLAEFREVMDDLLDAVTAPGALDRTIDSPLGELPGDTFARFLAFDGLVHGWDIAVSTGTKLAVNDDVVDAVDSFARTALTDDLRDGDTFKRPAEPLALSSNLDDLAAFSGRTVKTHAMT